MRDSAAPRMFFDASSGPQTPTMFDVFISSGIHFVIRTASVDKESVEWMSSSLFIEQMRQTPILNPGGTILDLGSHIGSFALVAAREKHCRVIGFEPDADSLRIARANAVLNGLDHLVEFRPFAIGSRDGEIPLYAAKENWGHTIIEGGGPSNELTGKKTIVRTLSLDSVLSQAVVGRCAFLKFNIEGAEFGMIEGASQETLSRIDVLAGELHYDLGDANADASFKKLASCGFTVKLFPDGERRALLLANRARG
jgi:FkbM family methyltransferase